MVSLASIVVGILIFFISYKELGVSSTIVLFGVLLLIYLWKRRAKILTRLASQFYFIFGNAKIGGLLYHLAYKTGHMSPNCRISYSAYCLRENMFEFGEHLLTEVISSRRSAAPEKLNAKHNLAILLWKKGDLPSAISLMEVVHKQLFNTPTYASLGVLYLEDAKKTGDFEKHLPFMIEAYEYNDEDKTICDNLGELYILMNEFDKAKDVYETLLQTNFITPVPYYHYAQVLKALGDNAGAKIQLQKALNCKFTSVITITKEDVEKALKELEN